MGSYPEWQGRLRSITIDSIGGKITIVLAVFYQMSSTPLKIQILSFLIKNAFGTCTCSFLLYATIYLPSTTPPNRGIKF